jgi:ribosomal protein S18 acetylase RimI-like enzyme
VPVLTGQGGWTLRDATERDLDQLMGWFVDARSVNVWGGPKFRYPFTSETFREDCQWGRMATFVLKSPDDGLAAFGQIYERYRRINLARLVVHPDLRGQGVGRRLVELLLEAGPAVANRAEFSLFVYRDNTPALECYLRAGFRIRDYPEDAPMADVCYYLTRSARGPNDNTK